MKQINIANAYSVTEKLSESDNLTIAGKWALYKLRKDLSIHYDFYIKESRELFITYKEQYNAEQDVFDFDTPEKANEFRQKQKSIDEFDIEYTAEKEKVKLSDIPNITVQQIEMLDDFIEFIPE